MMLKKAAKVVEKGGVIAYPTEAVWGLGCDPFNQNAVQKLLNLKNRSVKKGLIVISAGFAPVAKILDYLSDQERHQVLAQNYTTFLFEHHQKIPTWISGGSNKFALRFTKHLPCIKLCEACGGLLVSTSANLNGLKPAISSDQVRSYFGLKIDFIYQEQLGNYQNPSPIIDFANGKTIRS